MDDADRAQIEIEREAARRERERQQYHLMPQPAARIGAQGERLCMGCGEPLNARRLVALPFAVRCVECQERAERGRR